MLTSSGRGCSCPFRGKEQGSLWTLTDATGEMSCGNELRAQEVYGSQAALTADAILTSHHPASTSGIPTFPAVLREQPHPWKRAWGELVSSHQSSQSQRGKPHLPLRDTHCSLMALFFPLKVQTCVFCAPSWILEMNPSLTTEQHTTSELLCCVFLHWMTASR